MQIRVVVKMVVTSWSRLRLRAHSLAIEVGLWNRCGRVRLLLEERVRAARFLFLFSFNNACFFLFGNFIVERTDYDAVYSSAYLFCLCP